MCARYRFSIDLIIVLLNKNLSPADIVDRYPILPIEDMILINDMRQDSTARYQTLTILIRPPAFE